MHESADHVQNVIFVVDKVPKKISEEELMSKNVRRPISPHVKVRQKVVNYKNDQRERRREARVSDFSASLFTDSMLPSLKSHISKTKRAREKFVNTKMKN